VDFADSEAGASTGGACCKTLGVASRGGRWATISQALHGRARQAAPLRGEIQPRRGTSTEPEELMSERFTDSETECVTVSALGEVGAKIDVVDLA
jgi:hypothetical protein